jgi:hypothetical protein
VRAALALVLGLMLAACSGDIAFKSDNQVRILAPKDRKEVSMPLTIRWSVSPAAHISSFLIAIDRNPQPPGDTVRYFVSKYDQNCKGPALATCLTPASLEPLGIYRTPQTQVTLDVLPQRYNVTKSALLRHEATIVPLDKAGRRIGESAWTINFTLAERGA